jgi:hypothetical protein
VSTSESHHPDEKPALPGLTTTTEWSKTDDDDKDGTEEDWIEDETTEETEEKTTEEEEEETEEEETEEEDDDEEDDESTESDNGKAVPVVVAGNDENDEESSTTSTTESTSTSSTSTSSDGNVLAKLAEDSDKVLDMLKNPDEDNVVLNENDHNDEESTTSTSSTSTSSSSSTTTDHIFRQAELIEMALMEHPDDEDEEASVTDASELMKVDVDVDVDTDDTVRLTMVLSDSDTDSTPSTRSTPVFSETALLKVASQLLLEVPQGSFLATRYRDDHSELLRIDPHTGDVALVEQFEPLYKITSLLSNPHTGEIYAFVNDMRAAQHLPQRRRGGLYEAPPMLVRVVEQGGWHVVCDRIVRHLDVDSSSASDGAPPDEVLSRARQPSYIADAKFDPADEKHIYAYDTGLKSLGSVRIDHCAFRTVGRPGGDDDVFDNSLAFAHADKSDPVIYFSRFQEIWRLNDTTFQRVAHTARFLVAPHLVGNNNEHLLTSMDFDHTNGLLFGILSEVDDDRVRLATRLVRIDPITGAMVVIGESDASINSFAIRPAEHAVGLKDLVEMLEGSSTSTSSTSSTSSSSTTDDADDDEKEHKKVHTHAQLDPIEITVDEDHTIKLN